MLQDRQKAFDNISRALAITRYDIEQRQSIGDYSLNIHSEDYFRDVFNFVYEYNFENANFESMNVASIDLIDKNKKLAYQITTTKTKDKIENTLKALNKEEYEGYSIKIYYLLEKATPQSSTIEGLNTLYDIDLKNCLLDYTDLIRDINDLETNRLIELNRKYFEDIENRYTDEMILDLVFRHLIQNKSKININYLDDFVGTVDSNKKLEINSINNKISIQINEGLDYREMLNRIDSEDNVLTDLKKLVVEDLYKSILLKPLSSRVSGDELINLEILDLHNLATKHNLNFNNIINNLYIELENRIDIKDFNSTSISWIIIAYFFEICDVGVKK